MAEPTFSPIGDDQDDLPRTFRREKEAREREAREREAKEREARERQMSERQAKERAQRERAAAPAAAVAPSLSAAPDLGHNPQVYADPAVQPELADMPYPATIKRFDVPFFHLMTFFLKAVVAAIPALILLTAILWILGQGLSTFFPELVKMKILIGFGG
jgi:hypothetical protein